MAEIASNLSIGQVAQRTGLTVHTLRFYEREGIFPTPVRRGSNGHRIYGEDDVEWLTVCTKLRASGMPLAEIGEYARLVGEGAGNEKERLDLLRRHKENVSGQLAELSECLRLITHKVGLYEDRLAQGTADHLCTDSAGDRARD